VLAQGKLNLPADINEQLAREAAAYATRLSAPGGDRMQVTQGKTFRLPSGQEHPGPMSVIIVDFIAANHYYPDAFNHATFTPARCYALGLEPSILTPSDKSLEKQADSCASCWANQFGSDLKGGRGKACQNGRLLALMAPDSAPDAPLMVLKVSPTAVRAFDAYVSTIARAFNAPARAVVTDISFDGGSEYPTLRFGKPQPCSKEQVMLAHFRKQEALDRLLSEPEIHQGVTDAPVRTSSAARSKTPALAAAGRKRSGVTS
ncbi:MAG: hypothetical protein ACXWC1_19980, partial [Burkholderiales bacterium]